MHLTQLTISGHFPHLQRVGFIFFHFPIRFVCSLLTLLAPFTLASRGCRRPVGVITHGLKSCEPGTPEGGMREEGVRQAGEIEKPATNGAERQRKKKKGN